MSVENLKTSEFSDKIVVKLENIDEDPPRFSNSHLTVIKEEPDPENFYEEVKSEPDFEKLSDIELEFEDEEEQEHLFETQKLNVGEDGELQEIDELIASEGEEEEEDVKEEEVIEEVPKEIIEVPKEPEVEENIGDFDEPSLYEEESESLEEIEEPSVDESIEISDKIESVEESTSDQTIPDFFGDLPNDRDELRKMYETLSKEKEDIDKRNYILNKCLFKYFEKKLGYASVETASEIPLYLDKYDHTLEDYSNAVTTLTELKQQFKSDNKDFLEKKTEKEKNYKEILDKLLQHIEEIGLEVRNPKTGNRLSEKSIQKLRTRLVQSFETLFEVRLKFTKTDRTLLDLKERNDELNNLGDGFKMEDFEELRQEVEQVSWRTESKVDELHKLRKKCFENTQKMAHFDEKEFVILDDIQNLDSDLYTKRNSEEMLKDKLGKLIKEKERLRGKLNDLNDNAGLLNHPVLMKNYEKFTEEIETLTKQVDLLKMKNQV